MIWFTIIGTLISLLLWLVNNLKATASGALDPAKAAKLIRVTSLCRDVADESARLGVAPEQEEK